MKETYCEMQIYKNKEHEWNISNLISMYLAYNDDENEKNSARIRGKLATEFYVVCREKCMKNEGEEEGNKIVNGRKAEEKYTVLLHFLFLNVESLLFEKNSKTWGIFIFHYLKHPFRNSLYFSEASATHFCFPWIFIPSSIGLEGRKLNALFANVVSRYRCELQSFFLLLADCRKGR